VIKNKLIRKAKYAFWIPRKITRKPSKKDVVISDLFPLRSDSHWQTHFELLNVSGLISGDNSSTQENKARFVFFNGEGTKLAEKLIAIPSSGRRTIKLDYDFDASTISASSFAVFHQIPDQAMDIGESVLAERGYTGFSRSDSQIRGYVHGNFDSLAYKNGKIQTLGNKGIFPRLYTVQHPLRGPANYEFFLSNPTSGTVKVRVLKGQDGKGWEEVERFWLSSRGSQIFKIECLDEKASFIRIRSRFYLGRPVVFRIAGSGFDVFHG
jgi:hypothetical protein